MTRSETAAEMMDRAGGSGRWMKPDRIERKWPWGIDRRRRDLRHDGITDRTACTRHPAGFSWIEESLDVIFFTPSKDQNLFLVRLYHIGSRHPMLHPIQSFPRVNHKPNLRRHQSKYMINMINLSQRNRNFHQHRKITMACLESEPISLRCLSGAEPGLFVQLEPRHAENPNPATGIDST